MAKAKAPDLARELDALAERPREIPENQDPPRTKHPALFRAARAAAEDPAQAEPLARTGDELAGRLTDGVLLESIVELARDVAVVRTRILAVLGARPQDARWAVERQLAALQKITDGSPLDRLLGLTRDDPALDVTGEPRVALLRELVEIRLTAPTAKRDRPSVEVARGALRLLAKEAPRESASLAARTVEVETRRAGKEDPDVALAAIEVLRGAEPLEKLRAARTLERGISRRVILDRLQELASEAQQALAATPEEVAELLADDAGVDARGERRIELEGGEHALVSVEARGRVVSKTSPGLTRPLDADERREVEGAVAQIAKLRREHAQRLERALITGRAWKSALFREAHLGKNALLREVASRLVWLAVPAKGGAFSFRLPRPGEDAPLEDVFSGKIPDLEPTTAIRVAHPVELDADELELWRERFRTLAGGAPLVQPFPQLYRAVGREADPKKLERFHAREAYRDDLIELGRQHGLRGLPLRGDGPWELARDFPGRGAILALTVEPIVAAAAPAKPRRDAVRVLDEEDPRKPRAPREAAPRVRVTKVELAGAPDPAALAESAALLHALTDELACGTEGFFGDWQRKKFKDPPLAWKQAQERLALGSGAVVQARVALAAAAGIQAKMQGRFAVFAGELFLDLGSRHAFEGPLRDFVPPWKLDQRVKAAGPLELAFPHDPETDAESVRVVETLAALARTPSPAPEKS